MIWGLATALIGRNGLLLALIAGVAVTALTYDASRVRHGRKLEQQKTERANDAVLKRADRVRAGVRNKRVRGLVDPNARVD